MFEAEASWLRVMRILRKVSRVWRGPTEVEERWWVYRSKRSRRVSKLLLAYA